MDLAGFAFGFGFGGVFWIEGETSGEDAFDDGEFVAAAMAIRLRGVEVWQGDLAEQRVAPEGGQAAAAASLIRPTMALRPFAR